MPAVVTEAARRRAELAAIGRDLVALAPAGSCATRWDELGQVPGWLRLPPDDLHALARQVALTALADALARSIDGAWLGALARVAGEAAVDRALGLAETGLPAIDRVEADALEATGLALLAACLPAGLGARIAAAPSPLAAREAVRLLDAATAAHEMAA